jgi:hypothetical protein
MITIEHTKHLLTNRVNTMVQFHRHSTIAIDATSYLALVAFLKEFTSAIPPTPSVATSPVPPVSEMEIKADFISILCGDQNEKFLTLDVDDLYYRSATSSMRVVAHDLRSIGKCVLLSL